MTPDEYWATGFDHIVIHRFHGLHCAYWYLTLHQFFDYRGQGLKDHRLMNLID